MRICKRLNELDDSFSQHMRKIEELVKHESRTNPTLFYRMLFPYIIVQMANTWGSFLKHYYLSCAVGTKSTSKQLFYSPVTNDINQALGLIITRYKPTASARPDGTWHRRDEPTWHDYNTMLSGSTVLNLNNDILINNAFSSPNRVFKDLVVFRNFFAHKNKGTEQAARLLALQYGIPSTYRPSSILMQKATSRTQEIIYDWIDELVFTCNYLCY